VVVERQVDQTREQLPADPGDDPLAHNAQQVALDEAADRLGQEQDDEPGDEPVEPFGVAAVDDGRDHPGHDQRHGQRQARPHDQSRHGEAERSQVRPQVAEQATPRDAADHPDATGDLRGVRRRRQRAGHAPMMPRADPPAGTRSSSSAR